MMNVINGGAHAANNLDIQEFMIIPFGATSLAHAVADGGRDLPRAEKDPAKQGLNTAVGDEGGFAPDLESNEAALRFIMEAIRAAGLPAGQRHRRRPGRCGQRVLQEREVST